MVEVSTLAGRRLLSDDALRLDRTRPREAAGDIAGVDAGAALRSQSADVPAGANVRDDMAAAARESCAPPDSIKCMHVPRHLDEWCGGEKGATDGRGARQGAAADRWPLGGVRRPWPGGQGVRLSWGLESTRGCGV